MFFISALFRVCCLVKSNFNGRVTVYPSHASVKAPVLYEKNLSTKEYIDLLLRNANQFIAERKVLLLKVSLQKNAVDFS